MAKRKHQRNRTSPVEPALQTARPVGRGPRAWLPFAVLAAGVAAVFGRAVTFGFLDWDDMLNIHMNPAVMAPTAERFAALWMRPFADMFIPLVYTSFIADAFLSDGHAAMFHFTNLLLHFAACCFVYLLVTRVVDDRVAALLGTLLFALHPLQVEPVTWITGRKDVLSGALSLGSVYYFVTWLQHRGGWRLALSVAAFVCALLSKPSAVTTPALMLGFAAYFCTPWLRGRTSACLVPRRTWLKALAGFFAAATGWVWVSMQAQTGFEDAPFQLPIWKRPFLAADCLVFYLQKLLWPAGLAPIYPRSVQGVFQSSIIWVELPAMAALTAAALWARREYLLSWWLFVVPLSPVLGLTPFLFQFHSTVADRYVYVSFLAVALFAAHFLSIAFRRVPRQHVASVAGAVILVLAWLSIRQAGFWRDPEVFWKRELAIHPTNSDAWYNLGTHYAEMLRIPDAERALREAVRHRPNFAKPYTNLIVMYRRQGRSAEARALAERVIRQFGKGGASAAALGNTEEFVALGHAYSEIGDNKTSAWAFRGALQGDPTDADAHLNLGNVLMKLNDLPAAEQEFRKVMELSPRAYPGYAQLSIALTQQGKLQEAQQLLRYMMHNFPGDRKSEERLRQVETALGAQPFRGPGPPK